MRNSKDLHVVFPQVTVGRPGLLDTAPWAVDDIVYPSRPQQTDRRKSQQTDHPPYHHASLTTAAITSQNPLRRKKMLVCFSFHSSARRDVDVDVEGGTCSNPIRASLLQAASCMLHANQDHRSRWGPQVAAASVNKRVQLSSAEPSTFGVCSVDGRRATTYQQRGYVWRRKGIVGENTSGRDRSCALKKCCFLSFFLPSFSQRHITHNTFSSLPFFLCRAPCMLHRWTKFSINACKQARWPLSVLPLDSSLPESNKGGDG